MFEPKLSVIMAVHNCAKYLDAAVSSILNQTFSDFEFIIIDDGSKDRSRHILEFYAKRDSRIHLVCRENRGLTKSLNEAIALSKSGILARMDGDDIALPTRFERQLEYLRTHPDVVCVGGGLQYIDGRGRFLMEMRPLIDDTEIQREALAGRSPIAHPAAMMRHEAVRAVDCYDESMCLAQDLDLWLRLGEIGKLGNVIEPVLKYRIHEQAISGARRAEQSRYGQLACKRAWQRRGITEKFWGDESSKDCALPTVYEETVKHGWWAFSSAQRRTALIYGAKGISLQPFRSDAWRLLACTLRGR